ncbi:MAG: hypothetical protein M3Q49_00910 [Actinomycetota bacterium]|nr:hypothetical protein [Actinomycetota bacterium]
MRIDGPARRRTETSGGSACVLAGPTGRRGGTLADEDAAPLPAGIKRPQRRSTVALRSRRGGSADEPERAMNQNRDLKRTRPQTKRANRELRRYTDGVGYRAEREAFPDENSAKCYAVAILLRGNLPRVCAEAGALIACMALDQEAGILDYVRRPTAKARSIRDRALGPLVRRWGYPDPRWLDRLNEDIRGRERTLDAQERDLMSRDPDLYRKVIVGPAFRDERGEGRRR